MTPPSYLEQIGRNTKYIIHPEETLAENSAHLMFKTENLPTPRVVNEIGAILT